MVNIEKYNDEMAADLWQVYFTSIRMICTKNYSKEQIQAWAPESFDLKLFKDKMEHIKPFVALFNGSIVGYADLQPDGLIDHFFVHGNHQGKGAGTALMKKILDVGGSKPRLYSYVSHTAKSFYLRHSFFS
jgi:putative acetyltransferase